MRTRSTRSPIRTSSAGSAMRAPSTATPTTSIAAMPSDSNVESPASSMPAIATATVSPETITARPEVAEAISTDSRTRRAALALVAGAAEHEERVVDADRHADDQQDALEVLGLREDVARDAGQAEGRDDRGQREDQRDAGGDERAEDDDQDQQREREREHLGAAGSRSPSVSLSALSMAAPPTSSMRRPGVARPALGRRRRASARRGCSAVSASPAIVNVAIAARSVRRQPDAGERPAAGARASCEARRRGGRASRRRALSTRAVAAPDQHLLGLRLVREVGAVDDALSGAGVAAAAVAGVHDGAGRDAAGDADDDEEEPEAERPPGAVGAPVWRGGAVRVDSSCPRLSRAAGALPSDAGAKPLSLLR